MDKNYRPFPDRDYRYNPAVDLQEVDQFGFVNLNEAFEKGIIPSIVPDTDIEFNGVMNPGTLLSHAQDVFDGIRKSEYVSRTLAAMDEHDRKIAEAAAKVAPESTPDVTE